MQLSRHQYYYQPRGKKPGRAPTQTTLRKQGEKAVAVSNQRVVDDISAIQSNPDTRYGYRKMYFALMMLGYFINHKKVYRLMLEHNMLGELHKRAKKNYATYRVVAPEGPLQLLEMDIKYVWITRDRRHAYILTVIDTFSRQVLLWQLGFTMQSTQVRQAWERIIEEHLQPADMLNKHIHVEVRNDNGPQFASKQVQDFFKENYLGQVFTHPYTPQENGHVESFHSILSSSLSSQVFWDIDQLNERLTLFYETYNNTRLHASIANLPPRTFTELWHKGLIERRVVKKNKVKFLLKIRYQQLSGNENLREAPCLNPAAFDTQLDLSSEAIGPETLQQPSVQRSPSVVPC